MNNDEFREYKAVIQGALDLVEFDSHVDIQHQNIIGIDDVITMTSTRSSTVVTLMPDGHIFRVGYTQNDKWTVKEIDLAAPDSLQTLGAIVKRILGPSWAAQK